MTKLLFPLPHVPTPSTFFTPEQTRDLLPHLREAKERLSTGFRNNSEPGWDEYICNALSRTQCRWPLESEFCHRYMEAALGTGNTFTCWVRLDPDNDTRCRTMAYRDRIDAMQPCRHAWLDQIIEAFERELRVLQVMA